MNEQDYYEHDDKINKDGCAVIMAWSILIVALIVAAGIIVFMNKFM